MQIRLTKQGDLLKPFDAEGEEWLRLKHDNQYFEADIATPRNVAFNRKFFALLNVAYPYWNPESVDTKHGKAEKSFEQFRKDLIIIAGYWDLVPRLIGEPIIVAKSISFAKMDNEEFTVFYDKVLSVIIQRVLKGYTISEVDDLVGGFL